MDLLMIILQTNYEDWGVQSMLIGTIVTLGGVIGYLYVSKENALKAKDDKILAVIKEHQGDLKDANKDMTHMVKKYYQFMQQITDLVNGRAKL